jgi:hypothetical protein
MKDMGFAALGVLIMSPLAAVMLGADRKLCLIGAIGVAVIIVIAGLLWTLLFPPPGARRERRW